MLNERNMMFREMRRKRQLLPPEESLAILERMTGGTLALHGDNGYPYAVPVSYVYADGKIYFHSAVQGHKMDAIRQHPEGCSSCERRYAWWSRARLDRTDQGRFKPRSV